MRITNGVGDSTPAKVDDTNRLMVRSTTSTEVLEASSNGESFILTSGFITFTNANESAILYYKNNEDRDVIISRFIGNCRTSTGGTTNHALINLRSNPTGMVGGTGQPAAFNNLNLGSSKTILADSEVGLTGSTLTNGSAFSGFIIPIQNFSAESSSIRMPKGSSIGITVTPPAGNTSFSFAVGLNIHLGINND